MENCIFCKVIAGELPSEKIYENDETMVILDIVAPVNPGHALVITKQHYENIFDTPEAFWEKSMRTAKKIAPAICQAMNTSDININVNNGYHSGQRIFHLHIHLIPRLEGDGHEMWHGKPYKEGEAKIIAEKIKKAL